MPRKSTKQKEITEKKVYCSLDIETSDFDAAAGEILEVGLVLFEIEKGKIKELREWESTFKPAKEVSPRILALTGISTEELEDAPQFKDKREEIQQLVQDTVMVGHNINFDITFLEKFGIKFSGRSVDTLDLAQMFLPTISSYNLESLMGLLKVDHKKAHRALADSKASIVVLEKLFQHYATFSEELKNSLSELFSKSSELSAVFAEAAQFVPQKIAERNEDFNLARSEEIAHSIKENREIICFPLGFDYHSYIYGALQKNKEKTILVLPSKRAVYQLWKNKLAQPYFENYEMFDKEKFQTNLKKKMSEQQKVFFAKVLVWQHTNWQQEVLVDLNFSFFGNQYRALINFDSKDKPVAKLSDSDKVIAVDYANFINFDFNAEGFPGKSITKRKALILDINNFESALTYATSKKVSWSDFIFSLKQIYDPQTGSGKDDLNQEVGQALAQVDLFFGLASLNWQKINSASPNILVDKNVLAKEEYENIRQAAENFCDKMQTANKKFKSDRIDQHIQGIRSFFEQQLNIVHWVEIFESRLAFYSSPIDLKDISDQKLNLFKKIVFTASLGSDNLINYFVGRLNLSDFKVKNIGQQELRKKFEVIIAPESAETSKLLELLQDLEFPAALLMPNSAGLKDFYEQNFKILQKKYKVLAQGYSGGANKLLENFTIAENSLFLGTDKFVLKQIGRKLSVKTLILSRLPFEQFNHPLFAAQAEKYQNQFVDFNIPRALYNFHSVIKFFYGPELQKIYILDQKIRKEYGKYFLDYLKSLPFVEIKN